MDRWSSWRGRFATVFLLIAGSNFVPAQSPAVAKIPQEVRSPSGVPEASSSSPLARLVFEPNRGQVEGRASFYARGPSYTAFFTKAGVKFAGLDSERRKRAVAGLRFVGGSAETLIGAQRLPGVSNYFIGRDRSRWQSEVPRFERVRYQEVYEGIDAVFYGNGSNRLQYDFMLEAGADPEAIGLAFSGTAAPSVRPDGSLAVATDVGRLRQAAPIAFQGRGIDRAPVRVRYRVSDGIVRLDVGRYDRTLPLVIDPEISYSTYLGGDVELTQQEALGIAVDASGSTHVAGATSSGDFPTKNALQSDRRGHNWDAFIAKFTPDGSDLVYATYLGGLGSARARAISVDPQGNAYVTGEAGSNFPLKDPIQSFNKGGNDVFVTKLSPSGSSLVWSTYIGDSGDEGAEAIGIDGSNNVHVAGETSSTDYPFVNGYPRETSAGTNAFLTKIAADGSSLTYSSVLGGEAADAAMDLVVSGSHAYVTGQTCSAEFPTKAPGNLQPFQPQPGGGCDIFVSQFDTAASGTQSLIFSTYLGGTAAEAQSIVGRAAAAIGLGPQGAVYVAGGTESGDIFPESLAGGSQGEMGGGIDGFLARLSSTGTALEYGTYLGGAGADAVLDLTPGPSGIWLAGYTSSEDFPTRDAVQGRDDTFGRDAFVAEVDVDVDEMIFSTPFGGQGDDYATGIVVDQDGSAYVAGGTESPDLPLRDRYQDRRPISYPWDPYAFVTKLSPTDPDAPYISQLTPRSGPVSGEQEVVIEGRDLSGTTAVTFGGIPSPSFSVISDSRIEAVSPPHAEGTAAVVITTIHGVSPANPNSRYVYGSGLWTSTGPMDNPITSHTATLLANGRVLVAGGFIDSGRTPATAPEIFDPKTGLWDSAASMQVGRRAHTATLLPNEKVLVVGGYGGQTSAETYDPLRDEWTLIDRPPESYCWHSATSLPDGDVLVAGGFCGSLQLASVFDAQLQRWRATSRMNNAHFFHHSSLSLNDGKVLVTSGCYLNRSIGSAVIERCAETYDPTTNSWTDTGDPGNGVELLLNGTVLDDGRPLIVGGTYRDLAVPFASAELYDSAGKSWKVTGILGAARYGHALVKLPDGRVLVAGGNLIDSLASAEIFDPRLRDGKGDWISAGLMNEARGLYPFPEAFKGNDELPVAAVLLSSDPARFEADPAVCGINCGKVLVVGGSHNPTAELYTPAPSIASISPAQGPVEGTTVTITGTGFTHDVREVRFGDATVVCPSPACTIESYSKLSVIAPEHDPGAVDVVATNEGGYSSVTDASRFTYVATPGDVRDLKAKPLSGSEVKLTFRAPAALDSTEAPQRPAQRFVIKQSASPITTDQDFAAATSLCSGVCTFTPPIEQVGDAVSLTVKALAPGTTYHYALKVIDASGSTGPISNPASATTSAVTPGSVTDLRAEATSETKIKLTFSAAGSDGSKPPPINDYVIKQSSGPITDERAFDDARTLCPDACRFAPVKVGDTLTLEVTDLTPGTTYHYALRPRDQHGNFGPRSNTASATTKGTAPGGGQATPVERAIRLRLKGHLVATGKVTAEGPRACVSKVRVLIHRNRKKIKTITSKDDGRFRVRLPDRNGRYRATAQKVTIGDNLCLRAAGRRRHRH